MPNQKAPSNTLTFLKRALVAWAMGPLVAGSTLLFQNCNRVNFGNSAQDSLVKTASFDYTTEEDTPLTAQPPSNLLIRGTPSLFRLLTTPRNGSIESFESATGKFTYRPHSNFTGQDEFDYSEEPQGIAATAKTIRIRVLPLNDTPMILTDEVGVELNTPKNFSLMIFDIDDTEDHTAVGVQFVNGAPIMNEIATFRGGRLVPQPNKTFTYHPPQNFRGIDKVNLYAKDGSGAVSAPKEIRLNVANPFDTLKPALALRGAGCVTCHSNIRDNFITDFGAGSATNTLADFDHFAFEKGQNTFAGFYSDHQGVPKESEMQHHLNTGGPSGGWLSGSFEKVTVPRMPLSKLLPNGFTTIEQVWPAYYLTDLHNFIDSLEGGAHRNFRPYTATTVKGWLENLERLRSIWPVPRSWAIARKGDATPASVSEASVYIGVPTSAQLVGIGGLNGAAVALRFFKDTETSPDLSGLVLMSNDQAYRNSAGQDLVCDGDLFLTKPLLLKDLTVATIEGCRIHSTKPIMISGPIKYKNLGPADQTNRTNLQLLSTEHVSLGAGKAACDNVESNPGWFWHNRNAGGAYGAAALEANPIKFRTLFPGHSARLRATIGLNETQTTETLQGRYDSMSLLMSPAGQMELGIDASCEPVKTQVLAPNEPEYASRRRVDFERLLIVAPRVDSRYTGQFKGAIVAEVGMFSLSQFAYRYDTIFNAVPVLPLVPSELYLRAEPLQ